MKDITLFTLQKKNSSGGTAHLDTLSLEKTFNKLLSNFINNENDSFTTLETIILSCITIEAIIKEELKEINPALLLDRIDPVLIAMLSNKKDKLINPPLTEISDVKTANISILFERYLMFYKNKEYIKGIDSLFNLRNKILHAAQDNVIEKHEITLLLTRYVFPFIKTHVKVSDDKWSQVEKIKKVVYNDFKADLVRKIIAFKEAADKMTKKEKDELFKEKPFTDENETSLADNLLCPSCKYSSVTLASGVDFDWNPDGTMENGYYIARCRVCELELDKNEFEEIADNPDEYFSSEEQDFSWTNVIRDQEYEYRHILDYI
jgi:hypothetical protein